MEPSSTAPVMKDFSLRGKVVVLTGGAGIFGRGLSRDLAEAGATLVLASRHVAVLEKVAAEERARGLDVQAKSLNQDEEASILRLRDDARVGAAGVEDTCHNARAVSGRLQVQDFRRGHARRFFRKQMLARAPVRSRRPPSGTTSRPAGVSAGAGGRCPCGAVFSPRPGPAGPATGPRFSWWPSGPRRS